MPTFKLIIDLNKALGLSYNYFKLYIYISSSSSKRRLRQDS